MSIPLIDMSNISLFVRGLGKKGDECDHRSGR